MRGKGGRGKGRDIHTNRNGDTSPVLSTNRRLPRRRGRRSVSQVGVTAVAGKREKNRVMILAGWENEIYGGLVGRVDRILRT